MFLSMITESLAREVMHPVEQALVRGEPAHEDVQNKSLAAFADACHDHLISDLDKNWDEHKMIFSAQDEDWESSWCKRFGVPLGEFNRRFAALETRNPTMDPDNMLNRDPKAKITWTTGQALRDYLVNQNDISNNSKLLHMLRTRHGGVGPLRGMVATKGAIWLKSKPGSLTASHNTGLHGFIRQAVEGTNINESSLRTTLLILEYRASLGKQTTELLRRCKIPRPGSYSDFDSDVFISIVSSQLEARDPKAKRTRWIHGLITGDNKKGSIIPRPGVGQGLHDPKAQRYIEAAFYYSSATPEQMETWWKELYKGTTLLSLL